MNTYELYDYGQWDHTKIDMANFPLIGKEDFENRIVILYWGEIEDYDLCNYGHCDHTLNEDCGQTNSFSTSESFCIYG